MDRVLLVAHYLGGYVGHLMVLRDPERFDGYLVMGMMHLWQTRQTVLPNLWRLYYQVPLATIGAPLVRRTGFLELLFRISSDMDPPTPGSSRTGSETRSLPAAVGTPTGRSCDTICS